MKIHIVKKNETLWKIAKKYKVDAEKLIAVNPHIKDPNTLTPKTKVKIPSVGIPLKSQPEAKKEEQQKKVEPQYIAHSQQTPSQITSEEAESLSRNDETSSYTNQEPKPTLRGEAMEMPPSPQMQMPCGQDPTMMMPGMQPGMMPGMPQDMMPGMQPGMMPGMPQDMMPGMQPGMMPGMPQQMMPGMNPEMMPYAGMQMGMMPPMGAQMHMQMMPYAGCPMGTQPGMPYMREEDIYEESYDDPMMMGQGQSFPPREAPHGAMPFQSQSPYPQAMPFPQSYGGHPLQSMYQNPEMWDSCEDSREHD